MLSWSATQRQGSSHATLGLPEPFMHLAQCPQTKYMWWASTQGPSS